MLPTFNSFVNCPFCNTNISHKVHCKKILKTILCRNCKKNKLLNLKFEFINNELIQITFRYNDYVFAIADDKKDIFFNGELFIIPFSLLDRIIYHHKNNTLDKFIELTKLLK